jgi:3-dehydroquinate synthase
MGKSIEPTTCINLGERSYPIYVSPGLLNELGSIIQESISNITSCVVVTSAVIDKLYGKNFNNSLSDLEPFIIEVPDGEEAKTWDNLSRLIDEFLHLGLDRKSVVIAIGGGTIGDLVGFAGSIYMRGIRVVQVPTTILGQADSSIGGKTAVNHMKAKNLVGSFYQPSLVISDTQILRSLPRREIRSGLAEIVKHGVISSLELFNNIQKNSAKLLDTDINILTKVISHSVEIKASYIEQDEKEKTGIRSLLNYGHTVGHAIETHSDGEINHGEAISIGMTVAGMISQDISLFKETDLERQTKVLNELGLKTGTSEICIDELIKIMRKDKKTESGELRFILPTGIGVKPIQKKVDESLIIKKLGENY